MLEAASGRYVTMLTGPAPAQMALSTTPMNHLDSPGGPKIIDFGLCALGRHGVAYFLMNHEPAWVMESTTNWLAPDEQIVAFTMRADTMRSGVVTLYTAIGAPRRQVIFVRRMRPRVFRRPSARTAGARLPCPGMPPRWAM